MNHLSLTEIVEYSGMQVKLITTDDIVYYGLIEIEQDAISLPEGCRIVFPSGREIKCCEPKMLSCQSIILVELI